MTARGGPGRRLRLAAAAGLALLLALGAGAPARAGTPALAVLHLSRAEDPAYEPQPGYTGLSLRDRHPAVEGARLAIRESRIRGRALGLRFELEERALAPGEDAAAVLADRGAGIAILDLPLPEFEAAVAALGARPDLILFNIRHPQDALRAAGCAPALLHTLPSRAMLADALAQLLAERGWRRVLTLAGADGPSAAAEAAFAAAAAKFGLSLVDRRRFELTNDPRRRERSNIALLTGGAAHDVLFLADETGEFGRYVPYATQSPRPVAGSEGLTPAAWHWTLERYGAPQLNQRFERQAGRRMGDWDWAAWAAVRAVVEAVSRTGTTEPAAIRAYMESEAFSLDLYKGVPGSFRPWSGQLRQPVLLATHNAVIDIAPLEPFLHRTSTLDTLGRDAPEAACPARAGR